MKTKKEIPSHALRIMTGADLLGLIDEVMNSPRWKKKFKPMRADVAGVMDMVIEHLKKFPHAEGLDWFEDGDLFTVLMPSESPWLENGHFLIQYENGDHFAFTKAEIIEVKFSDWMKIGKVRAMRILNQVKFPKGKLVPFFNDCARSGTKVEEYMFKIIFMPGVSDFAENFEIADCHGNSRIRWNYGWITYKSADGPDQLTLVDFCNMAADDPAPEKPKATTAKKPAKEKKPKAAKPATYKEQLSAWMEKPHPNPAPLPVEKREQLSFAF
jgi:hypothetical protein